MILKGFLELGGEALHETYWFECAFHVFIEHVLELGGEALHEI